jgi:hypothetical protein
MTVMDERDLRAQLERAVEVIEAVAPPLDSLRSRATTRTRVRRIGWGAMGAALVAAVVLIAIILVPGGGNQSLTPAKAPTRASLVSFADARHAMKRITGPYQGENAGYYGAFTTEAGIVVASYRRGAWHQSGPTLTTLGGGRWVNRLAFAPGLGGSSTPTVYLRIVGGDISYAGSVLRRLGDAWRTATFGPCGAHGSAYGGLCRAGNSEPYLHHVEGGLMSVNNNCTPSCAGGTSYRVRWAWSPARQRFVAGKVTKVVR